MFKLLQRKFYSVLFVIAILIVVILVSAYVVIENALVSDYTSKTADIARKTTNNLQLKSDYVKYISLLFIENLMNNTDSNGDVEETVFNADVGKIKIYNSDISGLGIFWDDGGCSLSSASYLEYAEPLRKIVKKEGKPCWVIEKDREDGYLFFLTAVESGKNARRGFALIDATLLKKSISADNLFLKDASIYFSAFNENLYIIGSEAKKGDLHIEQNLQDNLKVVLNFPMSEVKNQLIRVKMYMCLFGIIFILFAFFVVYRMVQRIVKELESLKDAIDTYASNNGRE